MYIHLAASVSTNQQYKSKYIKIEGKFRGYLPVFSPYIYVYFYLQSASFTQVSVDNLLWT